MSDEVVSDSGGTMRRLSGPPRPVAPDLAALPPLPSTDGLRPAGPAPHLEAGAVVTWHYRGFVDVLRVVRDDERGLVAWLPAGSERLAATPRDGRGLRERSLAERAALLVAGDYDVTVTQWRGDGVLRVAPTGRPWSVWFFGDGEYVNLEVPHQRPVDGAARTHSRDLTLDLWVADGETWLKDEDELAAGVDAGWYSPTQGALIRDLADLARAELVAPTAWPLDEGWSGWRPPPEWDEPLRLPEALRA
ncbi:DUF402 domain-containing protein [Nocardioides anomalus]|uniref:DUF402 domain-containing protein n=1 Tax=Nocardioides anomalus TaxID=2712223 RepID=A0A6G6WI37_9ACTN|nr:DUF402 domain-containing protein [Nocardioides anomalus]QIG44827.1 DUF402 domain-containing protein [Nocardioides anomalus]